MNLSKGQPCENGQDVEKPSYVQVGPVAPHRKDWMSRTHSEGLHLKPLEARERISVEPAS